MALFDLLSESMVTLPHGFDPSVKRVVIEATGDPVSPSVSVTLVIFPATLKVAWTEGVTMKGRPIGSESVYVPRRVVLLRRVNPEPELKKGRVVKATLPRPSKKTSETRNTLFVSASIRVWMVRPKPSM